MKNSANYYKVYQWKLRERTLVPDSTSAIFETEKWMIDKLCKLIANHEQLRDIRGKTYEQ